MEQVRISIGTVERMTGINANTLRMWERRYKLGSSARSAGGQREYTATDIDHLKLIKRLINQGMRIGDIAQLPTKTLTSLLIEAGDNRVDKSESNSGLNTQNVLNTQVVGTGLSHYFKTHIKRYPRLRITCSEIEGDEWLSDPELVDSTLTEKNVLILQQSSLNKKHLESLKKISAKKNSCINPIFVLSPRSVRKPATNGGYVTARQD